MAKRIEGVSDKLLCCAREEFMERDFQDASLRVIAAKAGTHSDGQIAAATEGIVTAQYPGIIENCAICVKIDAPEATYVGGLVGTGLYYYGEETAFALKNCAVSGEITGAVTPGAVAGRAENCTIGTAPSLRWMEPHSARSARPTARTRARISARRP